MGSYYSRHLPPASDEYIESLPPLNDLDKIFKREYNEDTGYKQIFCEKSSYLFPTYAQHLIDSFIQTKVDPNGKSQGADEKEFGNTEVKFLWDQTTTPHNINLGPLYGEVDEETRQLRLLSDKEGEKGRLKSQVINGEEWPPFLFDSRGRVKSEFDKLPYPQGLDHILKVTGADKDKIKKYIFAFGGARTNLNPNISAWNTLLLREHNRIAAEIEKSEPEWDDDRVFEIARNVTMAQYLIQIVEEYIQHISGAPVRVVPDEKIWHKPWYKRNWITAEFSVLYRWHSIVPDTIEWGNKSYDTIGELFNNALLFEKDGLNGSLRDAIVQICKHRATAMRPFNTEKWMVMRDKKAVEMSRANRLQPFSKYSEYLGRGSLTKFSDFSRDPKVVKVLEDLYKTPDRVEFFVGLLCADHDPGKIHSEVMTYFVGMDAFSQALAHPLLSENVWTDQNGPKGNISEKTFGKYGVKVLSERKVFVKHLLERNSNGGEKLTEFVDMTLPTYRYKTAIPKIIYYAIIGGILSVGVPILLDGVKGVVGIVGDLVKCITK